MGLHFVLALAHKFFDPPIRLVTDPMFLIKDLLAMTFNLQLQLLPASLHTWRKEGGGTTAVLTFDLAAFSLYQYLT